MTHDNESAQYINIVLNEALKELQIATISPTKLLMGLLNVASILKLMTGYKELGNDIIWKLDTSLALRSPINIFEFAAYVQKQIREKIELLETANRNQHYLHANTLHSSS